MFLIIIQLYKVEYKEDVLLALTSCGIEDGCICEGMNLQKLLEYDNPLFRGLVPSENERQRYAVLVTATAESMDKVDSLINLMIEADIDIMNGDILQLIAVPAVRVAGSGIDWKKQT